MFFLSALSRAVPAAPRRLILSGGVSPHPSETNIHHESPHVNPQFSIFFNFFRRGCECLPCMASGTVFGALSVPCAVRLPYSIGICTPVPSLAPFLRSEASPIHSLALHPCRPSWRILAALAVALASPVANNQHTPPSSQLHQIASAHLSCALDYYI